MTNSEPNGSAPAETSDECLITAVRAGDDGAFARLVTRYKRRIFRLASRVAEDDDELEEICQTVFVKVYENLGKFRGDAPFEHWITKIAVHACHDVLRGRRHHRHTQPLEEVAFLLRDEADEAARRARESRQLLEWAMARLAPDQRMVITLMELEEMTVRETASLTGWSEANVKVRAHRARQALKKILEEHQ